MSLVQGLMVPLSHTQMSSATCKIRNTIQYNSISLSYASPFRCRIPLQAPSLAALTQYPCYAGSA